MSIAAVVRSAMERQGMTQRALAAELGVADSTIAGWRTGSVPLLRYSQPLADILDCPNLVRLIREARTSPCPVCGRLAVHGSNVGKYCGRRCQHTGAARQARARQGKAGVLAQHRVKAYDAAIDELCRRWCEPGGLCRDASCPVQKAGLSPLPLARSAVA